MLNRNVGYKTVAREAPMRSALLSGSRSSWSSKSFTNIKGFQNWSKNDWGSSKIRGRGINMCTVLRMAACGAEARYVHKRQLWALQDNYMYETGARNNRQTTNTEHQTCQINWKQFTSDEQIKWILNTFHSKLKFEIKKYFMISWAITTTS